MALGSTIMAVAFIEKFLVGISLVAPYPKNYPVIMILQEILLKTQVNHFTVQKFSQ